MKKNQSSSIIEDAKLAVCWRGQRKRKDENRCNFVTSVDGEFANGDENKKRMATDLSVSFNQRVVKLT